MTTACAWCLDPGCSGRPCRHTGHIPYSETVERVKRCTARAARRSAWTVMDEERAVSPQEASSTADAQSGVGEAAMPGRYRETCFTGEGGGR